MNQILILLLFIPLTCFGQNYSGTILYVIDGDTFVFQTETESFKVRMFGIDAPENGQDFGLESKAFMKRYLHKLGSLKKSSVDKYGRIIGILFIDSVNINIESVKNGFAWHYKYYCKDEAFALAENEAKIRKLGLWKNNNPTPPWEYRQINNN